MSTIPDKNVHFKLRAIGDNVENMQDEFQMKELNKYLIAKKFPGEDYRNVMAAAENNKVSTSTNLFVGR